MWNSIGRLFFFDMGGTPFAAVLLSGERFLGIGFDFH
jgi:hypothetical protein